MEFLFVGSGSPLFSSGMLVGILMKWVLYHAGGHQGFSVSMPERSYQIAVHPADEFERYLLRTHYRALAMIRAAAEALVRHRGDHAESPLIALGLTLRQRIQMSNLRGREKHRRCIRAGGDAGATADARRGVKRRIRRLLWD